MVVFHSQETAKGSSEIWIIFYFLEPEEWQLPNCLKIKAKNKKA